MIRPVWLHPVKGVRGQVVMIHINQLSLWTVHRSSPICHFILMENSINTFPQISFIDTYDNWDDNRHRYIISLYYSLNTNINLNLITADQLGFEPGSLGPKLALLPLCYAYLSRDYVTHSLSLCLIVLWREIKEIISAPCEAVTIIEPNG